MKQPLLVWLIGCLLLNIFAVSLCILLTLQFWVSTSSRARFHNPGAVTSFQNYKSETLLNAGLKVALILG